MRVWDHKTHTSRFAFKREWSLLARSRCKWSGVSKEGCGIFCARVGGGRASTHSVFLCLPSHARLLGSQLCLAVCWTRISANALHAHPSRALHGAIIPHSAARTHPSERSNRTAAIASTPKTRNTGFGRIAMSSSSSSSSSDPSTYLLVPCVANGRMRDVYARQRSKERNTLIA